jgi:hypothetical protein
MEPIRIHPVRIEDMGDAGARIFDHSGAVYELDNLGDGIAQQLVNILRRSTHGGSSTGTSNWSCTSCTFLNVFSNMQCEMCESPMPSPKADPEPNVESKPASTVDAMLGAANGAEEEEELDSDPIPASALAADGTTYSLGSVRPAQTILQVKQMLSKLSDMPVGSQSMYLMDDTRNVAITANLELRNHERISKVVEYTSSPTELQFAVMLLANGSLADFVQALPPSAPPQMTYGDGKVASLNNPVGISFVPGVPDALVMVSRYSKISFPLSHLLITSQQSVSFLCSLSHFSGPPNGHQRT